MNVFSRIYRDNAWNGIETRSGPGSHREPTRRIAVAIRHLTDWLQVETVFDAACGEGLWMPHLPGYMGMDVSSEALGVARQTHPNRRYILGDIRTGCLRAGLVICRDAIQHMSFNDGQMAIAQIATSRSRWMLLSTYIDGENVDIKTGDAYRPNLEAEPFNLPPALLLIHDGYEYHDGDRLRDPAKMLGLWRL
jgi:hypothetical protein